MDPSRTADPRPSVSPSPHGLGRRHLLLAWLSGGFGLGTNTMVVFLLPLRAAQLGASLAMIGLLVGVGGLLPAVLSTPVGAWCDRVGSRRVFRIGTVGTVVAATAMAAFDSYWALFGLQFLLGPSRSMGWVASQSYITSVGDPGDRSRNTSRFSFATNMSRMLGPLIAGATAETLGLRAAFVVTAVYAAFFAAIAYALPDIGRFGTPSGARPGDFQAARGLLRARGIQAALLLTFARIWASVVYVSFFPLFLVGRGVSAALAGTVIAMTAGVATVVSLLSPRLLRWGSKEMVTVAALACGMLGLATAPLLDSFPLFYVTAFLLGIGEGTSLPMLMAIIADRSPPEQRGLAVGLRISTNQAANATAPTAVGALVGIVGLSAGFPVAALVGALVLLSATSLHLSAGAAHRSDT